MGVFRQLVNHLLSVGWLLIFLAPVNVYASTTIYTGSLEKNLDTSEIKLSIPVGASATVVKTVQEDGVSSIAYVHSDHLSSTTLITDSTGNKVTDIEYYPYGEELSTTQTDIATIQATDRLYTGQRKDSDTDLYFYNARYYNPLTSRFISADKAQGPNRYAYVANNPVMRNDPSGLTKYPYDPNNNWGSKAVIDDTDPRYNELVKLTENQYNLLKKNPEYKNALDGQLYLLSAYFAMEEKGYTTRRSPSGFIDGKSPDTIVAFKNDVQKLIDEKKLRMSVIKDKKSSEYQEAVSYIQGLENVLAFNGVDNYSPPPTEFLDYIQEYKNNCMEQAFLAQYLIFATFNISTKLAWGSNTSGDGGHSFLVWTDPATNIEWQLDAQYADRYLQEEGEYFMPLSDYKKEYLPNKDAVFTYFSTGVVPIK